MQNKTENPSWHLPESEEDKSLAHMALAMTKTFDSYRITYTWPQKELPKTTEFGLLVVHGTPVPLVVVGAARDFDKGRITLHPTSDSHRIIISTDYPTKGFMSGSAVAQFGDDSFASFHGNTIENFFSIPHRSKLDGTGDLAEGFIATFNIHTGRLDEKSYFWGYRTAKLAVAFAGFEAEFHNIRNSYHGLTAILGNK